MKTKLQKEKTMYLKDITRQEKGDLSYPLPFYVTRNDLEGELPMSLSDITESTLSTLKKKEKF